MDEEQVELTPAGEATETPPTSGEDAVGGPRLAEIERLPLEQRADAYARLHDELLAQLESADATDDA